MELAVAIASVMLIVVSLATLFFLRVEITPSQFPSWCRRKQEAWSVSVRSVVLTLLVLGPILLQLIDFRVRRPTLAE